MLRPGRQIFSLTACAFIIIGLSPISLWAQEAPESDLIDVLHYDIDAQLNIEDFTLTATSIVTWKPLMLARSVVFEMNGSLIISRVLDADGQSLEFLQDRLDRLDVRVDLGQSVEPGRELKLTFEYSGELRTPEGGPVADRRFAYVGSEGSYLLYAARWFPFHKYASDLATYEIDITAPADLKVAGYSQPPMVSSPLKGDHVRHTLVSRELVLPGSIAVGPYITRQVPSPSGYTLEFFVKTGDERYIDQYIQPISKMMEIYSARFGPYNFGQRLQIVEIDNESMDYYVAPGAIFIAPRVFADPTPVDPTRLAREVAYQWWGQTVVLETFDDAWLSQGLAQFSALLYTQNARTAIEYEQLVRETMERALTFESTASIARAPAELYDLSPSYISIVYYKGAFVFQMLRNLIGEDKFSTLLKTFYQNFKRKAASNRLLNSL